jgi:integrase
LGVNVVERAILTARLVENLEPPISGEHWVADTLQRGFGLRMWRSPLGEPRKAYCIRGQDQCGKSIRRTFESWRGEAQFRAEHWWDFRKGRSGPTLGELIPYARRWAHDELSKLRGRLTLEEEEFQQREIGKRRASLLTLRRSIEKAIGGMKRQELTQSYLDRLEKLFFVHVPEQIADKKIAEVTSDEIESIFTSPEITPGNLRLLRPLLGQALEIPRRFGVETNVSSYDFRDMNSIDEGDFIRSYPTYKWSTQQYEQFFLVLESENVYWQQAICLRLYFQFRCPLSRLMAARWDELKEVTLRDSVRLRSKAVPHLEWWYQPERRRWEPIRSKALDLLRLCYESGEGLASPYWFPSEASRQHGHIRSIDHIWHRALHGYGLRYVSPRKFRSVFRATHPWYGIDFGWLDAAFR